MPEDHAHNQIEYNQVFGIGIALNVSFVLVEAVFSRKNFRTMRG